MCGLGVRFSGVVSGLSVKKRQKGCKGRECVGKGVKVVCLRVVCVRWVV